MMTMRSKVIDTIKHTNTDNIPWHIDLTTAFEQKVRDQYHCTNVDSFFENHLMRVKYKKNKKISQTREIDLFGVQWEKSKDGGDVGIIVDHPIKEDSLVNYQFPKVLKDFAIEQCKLLENEERTVYRMFSITMCYFERAWSLRGIENLLTDMYLNEQFTQELFDGILSHHLELLDIILDLDFEGVYFGDDWGQQQGLIMGPKLWKKYIKPGMAKLFEKVKSKGKHVILHSCGDLREILPDLVDMGLDIYNTVQPEIYDLSLLKKEYGNSLTFYGGISTQQFLPYSSVEEVKEMSKRVLEIMGKNGGYILSPTHAVTPDIPVENITAMIETVKTNFI